MNYITITIGGKERGWKVNQMTLEIWSKKTLNDATNSTSAYAAVNAGLMANCYVKNEEPDFTFEQVCDWVDELNATDAGQKVLQLIAKTFDESQVYLAALERMNKQLKSMQPAGDSGKKKQATK